MLDWNVASSHKAYLQARYDTLVLLEGVTTLPYVDSVGDATIGIGFNLVYNLEPVLRAMIGDENWSNTLYTRLEAQIDKTYAAGANATLMANLNRVMKDWHDNRDRDVPTTFAFRSDDEIIEALDSMDDYYDGRIDAWVAAIPESAEREALFSLCWNAPSMLGPKLKAAIDSGDRAEAWYEIRYNSLSSSLPASVKGAIANRRYVEADVFSLFDADGTPSKAEALAIGRMIASHHTTIAWYEASYDPVRAGAVKGVDIDALADEIAPAATVLLKSLGLSTTLPVEEILVASATTRAVSGDATGYDTSKNDDDLLIGDTAANTLAGGAGRDILAGGGGADLLKGGKGADIFVFSAESDSRPAGSDTIAGFAAGSDRIALAGLGDDMTYIDEADFSGRSGEIRSASEGRTTTVAIDLDGDAAADMIILLKGIIALDVTDFIL